MEEPINNHRSELFSLSLRDLFYKYIRFLPIIILSVALALFAAYAYLRYATPIFSVAGSMNIKSDTKNARTDRFEDMFVNDKAANLQSEIEVLKSKPLMQRVVTKLHLQINYFAVGNIKTSNIYKQGPFLLEPLAIKDSSRSFSMHINFVKTNKFTVNDDATVFSFGQIFKNNNGVFRVINNNRPADGEYIVTWEPTTAVAGRLAGAISVTPKSLATGILTIGMLTPNPILGADVVNTLMDEYGDYTVDEKKQNFRPDHKFYRRAVPYPGTGTR